MTTIRDAFGSQPLTSGTVMEEGYIRLKRFFDQAVRKNPEQGVDLSFKLAGQHTCFHVVGKNLAGNIAAAFQQGLQRKQVGGEQGLTVQLVSLRAAGVDHPDLSWPNGDVRCWPTSLGKLMISADGRFAGCTTRHESVCFDRKFRHIVGCYTTAQDLPLMSQGRPLFFPLSIWHHDVGVQIVHAALVGRQGFGLLIPGHSGTGKSTTAVACALAGFDYLGDDHVGLKVDDKGEWEGFGIYTSAWLDQHQFQSFRQLRNREVIGPPPPEDKKLVFLNHKASYGQRAKTVIRGIAVPNRIDSKHSAYRPASKADVFRSISLGTLGSMVPRPSTEDIERLADLVEQVPCYKLDLGSMLEEIPRVVGRLMDEVSTTWTRI